ncbi:MAG: protoporphyrinogen oxidase, partial [Mycobacteriales bacterium]
IYLRGELHDLPGQTVMGVPSQPQTLVDAGIVSAERAEQMNAELGACELLTDDVSVGELVRRRLGDEVVDNLIDPLLGGVYAGDVDRLSLCATIPTLADALRQEPSLLRTAATLRAAATPGPVFASVHGGMGRLAERTVNALRDAGVGLRSGVSVRGLTRASSGWELALEDAEVIESVNADAVLLAVPADVAVRLLAGAAPAAAAEIATIPHASVAIVNLVLPPTRLPDGSGVLVPSSAGLTVKAATFVDQKWGRVVSDSQLVRLSVGRYRDTTQVSRGDAELVEACLADLSRILGPVPEPLAAMVHRWPAGLPQYLVGQLDRVRRARELLAETGDIAIAGAGYDGVGIAACIGSAHRAAEELAVGYFRYGQ